MIEIPKFRTPFDFNAAGTAAEVVEQDSSAEIIQCVDAILRTPRGTRLDEPNFGIPDQSFKNELDDLEEHVEEWEPRAVTELTRDELEDAVRRATFGVDTRESR